MTTPSCQLLADVHDQYPLAMTAAERLKDVKPDRETRGVARGLANQAVLYSQFLRKMVLLSGTATIRSPQLHQIVTERLGAEKTGLLIGKLKEMLRLLSELTLDFQNVFNNETLRQQLQGSREPTARASSKKSKVQRRLDKVAVINLDLSAMLEPRLPLPLPDISDPSSTLRAFVHENQTPQSDAIRILTEAYGCSCPEPHVAGLRCVCSRCSPGFDNYEPCPGDWDFEVAFIAQPEMQSGSPLKRRPSTSPSPSRAQPTVWVSRLSHQSNHPNLAPNAGLCSFLKAAAGRNGDGIRHPQSLRKSPLVFSTLDELLRSRDPPLNRSNRMALAYRLSSAVLQAAGTPWADDSWKPKDWIVGVNDSEDNMDQFPIVFLNHRLSSSGQGEEAKTSPEDDWGIASADPLLARLGIALTQLALGQSFPDMRKEIAGLIGKDQVDSDNSELLDLLTTRRLLTLNQIAQNVSPAFQAVVAACVTQQYRDKENVRGLDTRQGNFLERAAAAILMPLYHEVRRYYLGHHQSKSPANHAPRAEMRRDQHILHPKHADLKGWKPHLTPKRLARKPRSETIRPPSPSAHATIRTPGGGNLDFVANASRTDAAIPWSEPSQDTGMRVAIDKPTEASSSTPKSHSGSDLHTPAAESTSDDDTGSMEIHNGDLEQEDLASGHSAPPSCDEDISTWSLGDYTESNQSIDSGFALWPSDQEFVYRLHDQHPLLALSDIALQRIFREFRISMAADWPGGGAMSGRQQASTFGSQAGSTAGGRKRQRNGLEKNPRRRGKDDEDEDEEAHQNPPPSKAGPSTEDEGPPLACPYFKKDPVVHQGCYKYRLTRIRDVKQHIGRRHNLPLYCSICFDVFPCEEERDNHIREKRCPQRPFAKPEGTTEEQRKKLGKRVPTNKSRADQWYSIFDILFDESVERPLSPYNDVDKVLYHGALNLQEFFEGDGVQVLETVLSESNALSWNIPYGERDAQAFRHNLFGRALRTMFQQWEARNGSTASAPNDFRPTTSEPAQSSSGILPTPPASVGQTWSITSEAAPSYGVPVPQSSASGSSPMPGSYVLPMHPVASFDFRSPGQGFGGHSMVDDVQNIFGMTALGLENVEELSNFDDTSFYTRTSNSEANFGDYAGRRY